MGCRAPPGLGPRPLAVSQRAVLLPWRGRLLDALEPWGGKEARPWEQIPLLIPHPSRKTETVNGTFCLFQAPAGLIWAGLHEGHHVSQAKPGMVHMAWGAEAQRVMAGFKACQGETGASRAPTLSPRSH